MLAQLETLQQFLPVVRLDGYYVVSDLVGVPNLFAYMRPVLVRLTRRGDESTRQRAAARLANLKPYARRVITAWVCLTAPILLVNVVLFVILAPRLGGAAWASAQDQVRATVRAYGEKDLAGVLHGAVGVALLVMPAAGTLYLVAKASQRLAGGARRWGRTRPALTTAGAGMLAVVLIVQVAVVWPDTFRAALRQTRAAERPAEVADGGDPGPVVPSTIESADGRFPPPASTSRGVPEASVPTAVEPAALGAAEPPVTVPVASAAPAAPATVSSDPVVDATGSPAAEDDGLGVESVLVDQSCALDPPTADASSLPERRSWLEELSCYAAPAPVSA